MVQHSGKIVRMVTSALLVVLVGASEVEAQAYLRGNFGWSWARDAEIKDNNFALDSGICGNAGCTVPGKLNDIGSSYVIGAGVGWRFSPAIRADLTFDYRGGYRLEDQDKDVAPSRFKADITSYAMMANVYYDFSLGGVPVKPFVGAGVGVGINKIGDVSITDADFPGVVLGVAADTVTELAWQVMGGLAWEVSKFVALEAMYRFFDAGNIEMGKSATCAPAATCAGMGIPTSGAYSGATGNLTGHEFLMSLRYSF